MEKEENQNSIDIDQDQELENNNTKSKENLDTKNIEGINEELKEEAQEPKEETTKLTPEEKIAELEDKVARTFAEMENQRRRFEKEKEEAYEYGGFSFAREALNLIDNLERSKQILKNDEKLKNSDALNKTLDHLNIIYDDLISIFSKNNIQPIESLNKKLDPNLHQAMIEIEDDQKEPGTIIQEIQKGFTLKNRLLRPSLVGVSKKNENNDKKNEENKENLKKK